MIRVAIFSILINCLLASSPVMAKSRAVAPIRCQTSYCDRVSISIEQGEYNPRRRGPSSGISSCLNDNAEIGKMIGRAYAIVRKNERIHGGTLYFQESSDIRSLIYSETFNVRESISAIAYDGDVQQCHRLRESAKKIINNILVNSF